MPPEAESERFRSFQCTPLQERQIRVLELLPFDRNDPYTYNDLLECRLITTSLDNPREYEALSYTWGKKPRCIPIIVVPEGATPWPPSKELLPKDYIRKLFENLYTAASADTNPKSQPGTTGSRVEVPTTETKQTHGDILLASIDKVEPALLQTLLQRLESKGPKASRGFLKSSVEMNLLYSIPHYPPQFRTPQFFITYVDQAMSRYDKETIAFKQADSDVRSENSKDLFSMLSMANSSEKENKTTDASKPEALFANHTLLSALRRLAKPDKSTYLWIDQLCINQNDIVEQGQQVGMMGEIYTSATRTVVWLGEAFKEDYLHFIPDMVTQLADIPASSPSSGVELISKLVSKDTIAVPEPQGHQDALFASLFSAMNMPARPPSNSPPKKDDDLPKYRRLAIQRFLNRQWFSRAWIFQEAALGRSVVFACAQYKLPFNLVLRLIQAIVRFKARTGGYVKSIERTTYGYDLMQAINEVRTSIDKVDESEQDFLGLLMRALRNLQAGKPQDLIYSFLVSFTQRMSEIGLYQIILCHHNLFGRILL